MNRANWDSRVPHHVAAYGLEFFRDDADHLSGVVRFDRQRLGSVEGLDVVHLQCHIGTDTASLARLGARSVTGLDFFSAPALVAAAKLAVTAGVNVEFVESELYRAVEALGAGRFDLVYTGSARCAGCRTFGGGLRWWRRCFAPVVGCSCARGIRCCGRSTISGTTAHLAGYPKPERGDEVGTSGQEHLQVAIGPELDTWHRSIELPPLSPGHGVAREPAARSDDQNIDTGRLPQADSLDAQYDVIPPD